MQYQEKLDQLEKHFEHLNSQMADPVLINDGGEYRKVAKAHSDLSGVIGKYREYKQVADELAQAKLIAVDSDPDMREMAALEITEMEPRLAQIEAELMVLLL